MGTPIKIADMASDLICLSGFESELIWLFLWEDKEYI